MNAVRWQLPGRPHKQPPVVRITAARRSLADDVRGRQRRYVVSMLVRTVAVLLTVLLWHVSLTLAAVTLALGVTLPYIAVVVANAGRENAPGLPSSFVTDVSRQALPPSAPPDAHPGTERPGGGLHNRS